ncbi:fibrous sheath-interacting protein 1 isoform X2 [Cynoglossus semilaevis]|uniref:Fibrous sheath-interacting protein 1 n=1 Tax=Cynoglossus semilaevis TaxID=244447 RepID=A0A3P8UAF5_CYNSE|nr:fibrous sheath-interacting protein 1 isoform X2 [Cynoglossus semilaevis]
MTMEIFKGCLDDISRPASSEQTQSERLCPTTPFELVVLTNDAPADTENQCNFEEPISSTASGFDKDEPGEDVELQRAIEEMNRLDEILSEMVRKEKEAKRQRKALQMKLWQELLQNKPDGYTESSHEALNTRLFLSLEAIEDEGEEEAEEEEKDFVALFETQVPDCDQVGLGRTLEQSEKGALSWTESLESGDEPFENSHCGASRGTKKQKDFVKRNIELVSGEGGQTLLTAAEKQRLAELLEEMDEEDVDSARGADTEEDMWAVSVLTGQGYTPEPSDLEQLIDIDSKMRLLLPDEEFHSVQSSYTNLGMTQGRGSEVGWKCSGDQQPGEKVLQDIKERRKQEQQLQKIQQQLEILGRSPETSNDCPDLTERQLISLLEECVLTESCCHDHDPNDFMQEDV